MYVIFPVYPILLTISMWKHFQLKAAYQNQFEFYGNWDLYMCRKAQKLKLLDKFRRGIPRFNFIEI
jgi:hypothetical protein